MQIANYVRCGEVKKVLEVTKKDVVELMNSDKQSFISVSEVDKDNLTRVNDDRIVGIIVGDIQNISSEISKKLMRETVIDPDCWFVFYPKHHGYKKLDENFKCDFGDAVRLLKAGFKVAREGWNGKGMFLFLVPGSTFKVSRPPLLGIYEEGTEINYQPHIDMKTADNTIVPWLASQSDILAEDYYILED